MGNEPLDASDSQGFINDPKGQVDQQFGDRRTANTGGGDYAGNTVDKRQNTFNFYLFGADPTTSTSPKFLQSIVSVLDLVADKQSVSRAYQDALPPYADDSRPRTTTFEGMVAQLEEFRRLPQFLQQIVGDSNVSEKIRKQLDELRLQAGGDVEQEKPKKESTPKQSSLLQTYLQIVVRQERGSEKLVVNAWLIPDVTVADLAKRYIPIDLEESRKGVSCQIEDVREILNRFLDEALAVLDRQYCDQQYELTIEMFLPRDYLYRDVDSWKMTVDLGFEEEVFPLGTRYHVLVRSQERLNPKYLRNKRNQWLANWERVEAFLGSSSSMPTDDDFEHLSHMQTCNWVSLANRLEQKLGLKVSCGLEEASKKELFNCILRSAAPIAVWPRIDFCKNDTLNTQEQQITQLLISRPLLSLMKRIRQKRKDAHCASCSDSHIGSHLAILWEDPHRLTPDVQPQAQLKSPGQ